MCRPVLGIRRCISPDFLAKSYVHGCRHRSDLEGAGLNQHRSQDWTARCQLVCRRLSHARAVRHDDVRGSTWSKLLPLPPHLKQSKSWSTDEIREYQESRFRGLVRRYGNKVTQKEDYRRNLHQYTRWDVHCSTALFGPVERRVNLFVSKPTHSRVDKRSAPISLTSVYCRIHAV